MNRRAIMDWKGGSALTLVWCRVLDAGFALPRDADRRSAFPCGRHHLDRWGSRAGLHFHSNWPEVGGPLPARRSFGVVREP